jgi:hypothetical protein
MNNNIIISLLEELLNNNDKLQNFKINIKPEIKECMLVILKENKEIFEDIDNSIINIIKDNKINTKDVPEFLNLIIKIYKLIKKTKIKKIDPYKLTKKILQTIFVIYIEYKDITDPEILVSALNIIKTTINLIKIIIN